MSTVRFRSWQSRSRKRARGEVTSRQARAACRLCRKKLAHPHSRKAREPDSCGSESGGRKRSGSGGRGASRVAFGKPFGRFVPVEQRASRRLCRTLGLPDFGKSSAIRLLFDRRGNRVRIRPDPFGGRVRRRVVGESLPVARLENRSRLARQVSESVAGRGGKSENSKLAVSLESRANRSRTRAGVDHNDGTHAIPPPRTAPPFSCVRQVQQIGQAVP